MLRKYQGNSEERKEGKKDNWRKKGRKREKRVL